MTQPKDSPGQKHNPSPNIKDTGDHKAHASAKDGTPQSEHRDPVLGTIDPLVRQTETLPTADTANRGGEPVGHARHAETAEELEKIQAMEGWGSDRKVPPPGSRDYVAGQPVNDEEYDRTEDEANRLAAAGREQRTEAEQRMAENAPGDPDYHPADPDHRDPQAGGKHPKGDKPPVGDDDNDDDKHGKKKK